MKKHKYNIFPEMNKEDYERLKNDLSINGFDESQPIYIYQNEILDGWNRFRACDELVINPIKETFIGSDIEAIEFVMRTNKRRNLTSSQWAAIAVEADDLIQVLRDEAKKRQSEFKGNQYTKPESGVRQLIGTQQKEERTDVKLATTFNTNKTYISEAAKLKVERPEMFEKVKSGEKTLTEVKKDIRSIEIQEQRNEIAKKGSEVKSEDRFRIFHDDIRTWKPDRQYDWIITDPPYPKEFLPLWEVLAERANEFLKDGGLLIAMSGQMYLNQIYEMMSKHLKYYWTACYLTLGQPTPLRHVNVNTTWKPLLIFSKGEYKGKIFGDVFRSDANEKDHHKWGQSVSGMDSIIKGFCLTGETILDPFCGAGTTGIAAINHGCFFDGVELELDNVNISKSRINECKTKI